MALRGSAERKHPDAPVRLDSDSLILMDTSDRGGDSPPAPSTNARVSPTGAVLTSTSTPPSTPTPTLPLANVNASVGRSIEERRHQNQRHGDGISAAESLELQRRRTDPSVRDRCQQFLSPTTESNADSASSTSFSSPNTNRGNIRSSAPRGSAVSSSPGIFNAHESVTSFSVEDPAESRSSFLTAPLTPASTSKRGSRSYDRRCRAKMEQENRASRSSDPGVTSIADVSKGSRTSGTNNASGPGATRSRGIPSGSPRRKAGANITHRSPMFSPQRAKQMTPPHRLDRHRSSGSADVSSVGIPPMLEDNADRVSAKIALYSQADAPAMSRNDTDNNHDNGHREQNEKHENDPINDVKSRQSHDEENLFVAPPNSGTVGLVESRSSTNSDLCFIGAPHKGGNSTEAPNPVDVDVETMQVSSAEGVRLSITNAVATDDLQEQIRQTIIGHAVHATEVTTIHESRSPNADEAVVGNRENTMMKQGCDDDTSSNSEQLLAHKRRMYMLIGCICVAIVIMLIVAVVLVSSGGSSGDSNTNSNNSIDGSSDTKREVSTSGPTEAPRDPEILRSEFTDWLKAETAAINPGVLDDTSSPQYKAFQWLLSDIAFFNDAVDSPDSDVNATAPHVKQRYALASLYYSTRNDTEWKHDTKWLMDADFCAWYGATCTADRLIDSLQDTGIWLKLDGVCVRPHGLIPKCPKRNLGGLNGPPLNL